MSSKAEIQKAYNLLKSLGIEATGRWSPFETRTGGIAWIYFFYFDNEDDMNFFKLASGKFSANCYLKGKRFHERVLVRT